MIQLYAQYALYRHDLESLPPIYMQHPCECKRGRSPLTRPAEMDCRIEFTWQHTQPSETGCNGICIVDIKHSIAVLLPTSDDILCRLGRE
jgi:hypothetical protein